MDSACRSRFARSVGKQMLDEKKNIVPARYSGEKSELVAEIKSGGKNVFAYDLKAE
jgi:hypothetical protein